jgi:hypothetical protein
MTDYYDLGSHGRPVSTSSEEAQRWFDRGLVWSYGYNHEEDCAMAYWGIANASGPNYNKPWEAFDPVDLAASLATAHDATAQAMARAGEVSAAERALIEALPARYPQREPVEDCTAWNEPYAAAVRRVYEAHPDDLDVATLFAAPPQHPDNVWSLHGLHECLVRLGKTAEAAMVKQRLDLAAARADVAVESSCDCRVGEPGAPEEHGDHHHHGADHPAPE